jgi:membrane fusion protein (multidrug efflux system)
MKLIPWLSVVVIVSASVSGLFYYKESLSNDQQMQSGPEPSAKVQAFRAQNADYQKQLSVIGEGQAVKYIVLKNELAGKVTKLNITSGDIVKKGQVLLELEHTEELASLASAKAAKILKQQTLARYQKLAKEKRISKENVDVAQAEYHIAIADLARLEAVISKKIILAPFDANIGIHDISVGQFLDSNTEITDLIGIDDFIWVDFKVPQIYPQLVLNSTVEVTISGASSFVGVSSYAVISSIEPLLTQDSRQLKYRAKVLKSELNVTPNQLVKVAVPVMAEKTVIMVPSLAIVRDQLGEYVFKLIKDDNGDYRAKREKVVLGDRVNEQVIVNEGLALDELVAAKGSFKLRPGLKVHFDNEQMGG